MNDQPEETYKILLVASLRYPIGEPFAGGLEAHTASLTRSLRDRGHLVVVAGAQGSDPGLVDHVFGSLPRVIDGERADITETPDVQAAERAGFTALADDLQSGLLGDFDVIQNNSLYPLLVERASGLPAPMITTLHTPLLPWARRVLSGGVDRSAEFVAVSRSTARSWSQFVRPRVVLNGIDTDVWAFGPGGPDAVWSGRLVAEKAPHIAIDIARAAGIGLRLAGPIVDPVYFQQEVGPRLDDRIRYVGHLPNAALADLVGRSAVALVTPAWDEPFGLVAAEAMACGTPVVAFARGGLPEVVGRRSGRLVPAPGADQLDAQETERARIAIRDARRLDRCGVRTDAVDRFSEVRMAIGYEQVYREAVLTGRAT